MIEFLSAWVKNIVYIIIFVVFLEILIPNNSMRKYVRVVAGLLVMVVVLTPITQVFNFDSNIQDVMGKYYIDMNQIDIQNQNNILEGQQSKMTMKIYKDKIENQIKNQIEKNIEGVSTEVEIEVVEGTDKKEYGVIKEVNLYLGERDSQDNEIKSIEKIEIVPQGEKPPLQQDQKEFIISQEKEREIKEYILDFYNVPLKNITISKQMNNRGEEE